MRTHKMFPLIPLENEFSEFYRSLFPDNMITIAFNVKYSFIRVMPKSLILKCLLFYSIKYFSNLRNCRVKNSHFK